MEQHHLKIRYANVMGLAYFVHFLAIDKKLVLQEIDKATISVEQEIK